MSLTVEKINQHEQLAKEGVGIKLACKAVGMSTSTYNAWSKKGEHAEEGTLERDFYERVVVLRREKGKVKPHAVPAGGLSQEVLISMLEVHALSGDREAVSLLLRKPWEKNNPKNTESKGVLDEFIAPNEG